MSNQKKPTLAEKLRFALVAAIKRFNDSRDPKNLLYALPRKRTRRMMQQPNKQLRIVWHFTLRMNLEEQN